MKITFVILGLIFVLIGVVCVYDARKITKELFSFQDINEGTKALKIFGFLIALLGMGIVYSYLPNALQVLKNMQKI